MKVTQLYETSKQPGGADTRLQLVAGFEALHALPLADPRVTGQPGAR